MGWPTARVVASLLALATVTGCLEPPGMAPAGGKDDGGASGADAGPCAPELVFDFEGGFDDVVWTYEGGGEPPIVDGSLLFELDGDSDGDATSYVFTQKSFRPNLMSFTIETTIHLEGEGEIIFQLDADDGTSYSFYAVGGALVTSDSRTNVCSPTCVPLVQDQPQRWRFRPVAGELWFEVAIDDGWEHVGTSELRDTWHGILLWVDTDGAGDLATFRVDSITVGDCPD